MRTCPNCGQENPDVARFCLACGHGLEAELAAGQDERRIVSVVFVDLVGFTGRSEKLDPEDVAAFLTPYHDHVRRELESFVTGDVVNTASRLQSAAPVNGVIVGAETYAATRDAIEYERTEPVQAKGKAAPVQAWIAVRPLYA